MALVLRKIKRPRWYTKADDPDELVWLSQGELQSAAFLDVQTTGNALSVFEISDDRSNLAAVIAALASNSDTVSNFDYVLIPKRELESCGVCIELDQGETQDANVNELHRNATKLTARLLNELVMLIGRYSNAMGRFSEKEVTKAVLASLKQGHLRMDDFKQEFRTGYEKRLIKYNLS